MGHAQPTLRTPENNPTSLWNPATMGASGAASLETFFAAADAIAAFTGEAAARPMLHEVGESNPPDVAEAMLADVRKVNASMDEFSVALSAINQWLRARSEKGQRLSVLDFVHQKSELLEQKVSQASAALSTLILAVQNANNERDQLQRRLAVALEETKAARHAALHDVLTGLPNRRLFHDRLEHGLAHATRHGLSLAVMFIDLDDFKDINDLYGHDIGDYVLQTVASRLKESARTEDTLCRYGGDEFLYAAMDIKNDQDAIAVAEKMQNAIRMSLEIKNPRGSTITLNINPSIGITVFPKNGSTAESLVDIADQAMYEAKKRRACYWLA